jgi:sugar lactone lactonase YvrE
MSRLIVVVILLLVAPSLRAQQVEAVLTSAGAGPTDLLASPGRPARTPDGALWVPAWGSQNMLRLDADGTATEVIAIAPYLLKPADLAFGPDGALFVASSSTQEVIRIATDGEVEAILDKDLPGPDDTLSDPRRLVVDGAGRVYVVGWDSSNLVRIDPDGTTVELVGPEGAGPTELLGQARAVAVDGAGTAYVSGMASDNVLAVTAGGVVTQVVGPSGDGAGTPLDGPSAMVIAPDGTLYVASMFDHSVLRRTPAGVVSAVMTSVGDGQGNTLSLPNELALAPDGTLYVSSFGNNRVLARAPDGTVSEVADLLGDGAGHVINGPSDLVVAADGTLYIASNASENLLSVAPGGPVVHVADLTDFGSGASSNGDGALALDDQGRVHVAYWDGNEVARLEPGGGTTTLAGIGFGPNQIFNTPHRALVDAAGSVFVAGNDAVTRFDDASGAYDVVVDLGLVPPLGVLWDAEAIVFDAQGRLVVALSSFDLLLRVEPDGSVGELLGPDDGDFTNKLNGPRDLVLGSDGTIYIANIGSANVLALRPDGTVENVLAWDVAHPGASTAGTNGWYDLAIDPLDRLFLADYRFGEVHRLDPDGTFTQLWDGPPNAHVVSIVVDDAGAASFGTDIVNDDYVMRLEPSGAVTQLMGPEGDGAGEILKAPGELLADGPGRVVVSGASSHNVFVVDLGFCGGFTLVQGAKPTDGSGPLLTGEGSLCSGDGWLLQVSGARPDAPGALVLGYSELSIPFKGGTLVPFPDELISIQLDDAGATDLSGTWPPGIPPGLSAWLQAWIPEPPSTPGYHVTNGLRIDTL